GARLPQIGPLEILVVLVVALVVFGPSKLPELGRQVGRGYREFRKFQQGIRDDIEDAFRDDEGHELEGQADDATRQIEASDRDPSAPHEPPPADTTS
ncbi:MAG TPA: twin-arginine translocase TatA/TatE family subunit, partial [Acidimicrobiia bacterium]|nr:twin-arginine translocase TatA/TatE family subunit [Acidimicrobiia bacterium]